MLHVDHMITFKIILHWLVDRLPAGIGLDMGESRKLQHSNYILGFNSIVVNTQILCAPCSEFLGHHMLGQNCSRTQRLD